MSDQHHNQSPDTLKERISELESSLHLFRSIADHSSFGLQVFDEKGFSYYINEKQKELLGIESNNEGIGSFNVLTDPYAVKSGASGYYKRAYEGETVNREFEYDLGIEENTWKTHREKRFFYETIVPIRDREGDVAFVAAMLQDVSEAKHDESSLKASEYRWKFAVEGNDDGLWDWNMITNEVYFSPNWKAMLGFGNDELENRLEEWDRRVHPDDKEEVYRLIQDHIDGKSSSYNSEHRVRCKNGTYKWILDRGVIMERTPGGKPARMIGTHSDISGRKAIEEEIIKAGEMLNAGEELSKTGAWEYITETSEMYWTDGLLKIHEFEPGKTVDYIRASIECYHPDDRKMIMDAFNRCIREGEPYDFIVPFITSKQNHRWVRTKTYAIRENGKTVRLVGSIADISEQQENEEKLQTLIATKDKFFSIIAHDLRGPLSAITGFAELVKDSVANGEFEKLAMYSDYISEATQKSFSLLNNLLEWSRIQTGSIHFEPEIILFEEVLTEVLGVMKVNIAEKQIDFHAQYAPGFQLTADRQMLASILRNLLGNALKYTSNKGKVTIEVATKNNEHEFRISDNGVGIPSEKMDNLFEVDSNFTTPGTNKEKGSGLGLILCKEFIEMHGGTIHAGHNQPTGTTFIFRLPVNP